MTKQRLALTRHLALVGLAAGACALAFLASGTLKGTPAASAASQPLAQVDSRGGRTATPSLDRGSYLVQAGTQSSRARAFARDVGASAHLPSDDLQPGVCADVPCPRSCRGLHGHLPDSAQRPPGRLSN